MSQSEICYYCNKEMADPDSVYDQEMYKVIDRKYREVKFLHTTIKIPRCKSCMKIHEHDAGIAGIGCVVFCIAGFVLVLISTGEVGSGIGGAFGAGVLGFLITTLLKKIGLIGKRKGNVAEEATRRFEPVKELLDQGWQTSEP